MGEFFKTTKAQSISLGLLRVPGSKGANDQIFSTVLLWWLQKKTVGRARHMKAHLRGRVMIHEAKATWEVKRYPFSPTSEKRFTATEKVAEVKDICCWGIGRKPSSCLVLSSSWLLLGKKQKKKLSALGGKAENPCETHIFHWCKVDVCGCRGTYYTRYRAGPKCTGAGKVGDRRAEKTQPLRLNKRTNFWCLLWPWTVHRKRGNSKRWPKKARES